MRKIGQGAIECCCGSAARTCQGQGATEYLVLLAVVLIVALISVALLGFFPGMASDAQITQSKTYWQSASPIAIVEMVVKYWTDSYAIPYLRVRNTGAYLIRITKLIGGTQSFSQIHDGTNFQNISDYYYLAPGEEKYFAWNNIFPGLSLNREIGFTTTASGNSIVLFSIQSVCSGVGSGTVNVKDFGFQYIQYLDNNQQITKREIGKPLIIKCTG